MKTLLKVLKEKEAAISMVLGVAVVIVIGALLFNYYRTRPEPDSAAANDLVLESDAAEYELEISEDQNGDKTPENLPVKHTVSAGEHLWQIAEKYYGSGYNWVDIASENNLSNANIINAGQEITIPKVSVKPATVAQTQAPEADLTATESGNKISGSSYTTERGDYLWDIAVRAYGDGFLWVKIYEANRELISNPNLITSGLKLTIPR